jgi:hypothetical protein
MSIIPSYNPAKHTDIFHLSELKKISIFVNPDLVSGIFEFLPITGIKTGKPAYKGNI